MYLLKGNNLKVVYWRSSLLEKCFIEKAFYWSRISWQGL